MRIHLKQTWDNLLRALPGWGGSLLIHLAILVPLCMVTWVVKMAVQADQAFTLSAPADAIQGAEGPAGQEEQGIDALGGGAAGAGDGGAAQGIRRDALSNPPPPPPPNSLLSSASLLASTKSPPSAFSGSGDAAGSNSIIRNLRGVSDGQAGGGGQGGPGGNLLAGAGKSFGEYVGSLRGSGLDLVLVIDATDSMSPYIRQAKDRLQEILDVVLGLVPKTRIGVVAYKDYGDDYGPTAVKSLRLTDDTAAVRKFIEDISAGGGGDEPEPIHEALRVATSPPKIGWQGGRKWVIILVGDSSCHSSGRAEAGRLAKQFAVSKGTINVIDVGGSGDPAKVRQEPKADLKEIALQGGGSAFFLRQEDQFWQHLILSVFGDRFKDDVDVIIKKFVQRRAASGPAKEST